MAPNGPARLSLSITAMRKRGVSEAVGIR